MFTKAHIYSWIFQDAQIELSGAKFSQRIMMEIFSALLAICAGNSPVTGEFPTQRPMTRSFVIFFDLRRNEWLGKPRLVISDAIAPIVTSQ